MASIRSRRLRNPAAFVAYLGVCTLGAVATGAASSGCSREAEASAEGTAAAELAPEAAPAAPTTYDPRQSLAPLVERVGPAVVSIHASGRRSPSRFPFGGFGRPQTEQGTGSGFILSDDGIVITNHHVAADADRLEVRLPDGRRFDATLLGSDPATDLAVLQLEDAEDLPTVTLGSSNALKVGDWVVAIGSPMGLQSSASVGILSGRGRGNLGLYRDSYIDFLQTDADIAPGSSGGPLFDLQGAVVGITTAVGAGNGPGFAIPIDQAKEIIPQLEERGMVQRGWLGAGNDPDREDEGAVIGRVFDGTPAAEAGLRRGDVVRDVDGREIDSFDALRQTIAALRPGHTILMKVERDGQTLELSAVLGERPAGDDLDHLETRRDPFFGLRPPSHPGLPSPPTPPGDHGPKLGVRATAQPDGLQVVDVEPGSLAAGLDLKPDDIVTRLNGAAVHSPADVTEALTDHEGPVEVEFLRAGVRHHVTLERS